MNQNIIEKFRVITDARALGLLAFGVVAMLVTWSGIKVVQTNYELEKKISVAKQRNTVEQLENENLKLKNKYYESDQYLELAARRQLGKAAPGEKLYTVPEAIALENAADIKIDNSQLTVNEQQPEQQNRSRFSQNFNDWIDFLFKR